jgi:hypothetical protein
MSSAGCPSSCGRGHRVRDPARRLVFVELSVCGRGGSGALLRRAPPAISWREERKNDSILRSGKRFWSICSVPGDLRHAYHHACQPTPAQGTLGPLVARWEAHCSGPGTSDAAQRIRCRLYAGQIPAMGLHRAGTRGGVHAVNKVVERRCQSSAILRQP